MNKTQKVANALVALVDWLYKNEGRCMLCLAGPVGEKFHTDGCVYYDAKSLCDENEAST